MSAHKRILVIEDEQILQDVYQIVLSKAGYEVHLAANGVEGLRKIATVQPDLILLDIFMPVMDGKEFLRNVNLEEYPDTVVIAYTNLSDKQTEKEMRTLGAHDFIVKSSLTPGELVNVVSRYLK
jgi:two-component system response regulator VicR